MKNPVFFLIIKLIFFKCIYFCGVHLCVCTFIFVSRYVGGVGERHVYNNVFLNLYIFFFKQHFFFKFILHTYPYILMKGLSIEPRAHQSDQLN